MNLPTLDLHLSQIARSRFSECFTLNIFTSYSRNTKQSGAATKGEKKWEHSSAQKHDYHYHPINKLKHSIPLQANLNCRIRSIPWHSKWFCHACPELLCKAESTTQVRNVSYLSEEPQTSIIISNLAAWTVFPLAETRLMLFSWLHAPTAVAWSATDPKWLHENASKKTWRNL